MGFTLIELLVVLIIVGILATLAISNYGKVAERSRQAEALTMLGALRGSQIRYYSEKNPPAYATAIGDLDLDTLTGKYFTYTLPATVVDSDLARATRNGVQQTAGISGYELKINRNGDISCTTSGAGDCVNIIP